MKSPQTTEQTLRNGWLYTGDIARTDADGYFQIVDRKKDVIVGAGGLSTYPNEIEKVLCQHTKIKMCAAIGIPAGPEKGERAKLFVVLEDGYTDNLE